MILGALAAATLSILYLTLTGPWWRFVRVWSLVSALIIAALVIAAHAIASNLALAAGLSRRTTSIAELVIWAPVIEEVSKSFFWRVRSAANWATPVSVGLCFGLVEGVLAFAAAAVAPEVAGDFGFFVELVVNPVARVMFHALLGWATARFLHLGRWTAVAIAVMLHAAHNSLILLNNLTMPHPEVLVAGVAAALAVGSIYAARASGPALITSMRTAAR